MAAPKARPQLISVKYLFETRIGLNWKFQSDEPGPPLATSTTSKPDKVLKSLRFIPFHSKLSSVWFLVNLDEHVTSHTDIHIRCFWPLWGTSYTAHPLPVSSTSTTRHPWNSRWGRTSNEFVLCWNVFQGVFSSTVCDEQFVTPHEELPLKRSARPRRKWLKLWPYRSNIYCVLQWTGTKKLTFVSINKIIYICLFCIFSNVLIGPLGLILMLYIVNWYKQESFMITFPSPRQRILTSLALVVCCNSSYVH